jgi:hypothetical protein
MHTTKVALLASVVLLATSSGCTTTGRVSLRSDGSPGPQECPDEGKKAMRYMGLRVGDSVLVELDANQVRSRSITLYDGPIESVTKEEFGPLGTTSRLYGQVWTSGPRVVIRYYEAQSPNGEKVPFCAVARLGEDQMRKRPESKPGTAIIDSSVAAAFVVDAFR